MPHYQRSLLAKRCFTPVCYFCGKQGVWGSNACSLGGSHASPPTSAFRRENTGQQRAILLPKRGMSISKKTPLTVLTGSPLPWRGTRAPFSHRNTYVQRFELKLLQSETKAHSACPVCGTVGPLRARLDQYSCIFSTALALALQRAGGFLLVRDSWAHCCISSCASDPVVREGMGASGTLYTMSRICGCSFCLCEHRELRVPEVTLKDPMGWAGVRAAVGPVGEKPSAWNERCKLILGLRRMINKKAESVRDHLLL